jgi:hypothetical protein
MSKIRKNVNYSYLCGGNVADFFTADLPYPVQWRGEKPFPKKSFRADAVKVRSVHFMK